MPEVILVDENDKMVGTMEKMEAHEKGVLHRAFSIFIFNEDGQILLQKRASTKYHCGGLWTNTCCSHPQPGESVLEAANRRLIEEMGLSTDLKEIFTFTYTASFENGLIENEVDHVLIGYDNTIPIPDPNEVEEWKYMNPDLAFEESVNNKEVYTPWFRVAIPEVIRMIREMPIND